MTDKVTIQLEIPEEFAALAAFALRAKANEYHGAIARRTMMPTAGHIEEWRRRAEWCDATADRILAEANPDLFARNA